MLLAGSWRQPLARSMNPVKKAPEGAWQD